MLFIGFVLQERQYNKMIEFPLDIHKVKSLKITDNQIEFDYFDIFSKINRNLIYLEK